MHRRFGGLLALGVVQAMALVLAHELVFLARYGSRFGEALVHAGHGESWSSAVSASLALGGLLAGFAVFRLARLGLVVRRRAVAPLTAGHLEPRALLRAWLRYGPRLALLNVVLLTLQENLERASSGLAAPGPGILLSPEYAGGLWIALGVGLAVGLVVAMFDWRRRALLARLRAARAPQPRATESIVLRPATRVVRASQSLLGRRSALRAPPVGASF